MASLSPSCVSFPNSTSRNMVKTVDPTTTAESDMTILIHHDVDNEDAQALSTNNVSMSSSLIMTEIVSASTCPKEAQNSVNCRSGTWRSPRAAQLRLKRLSRLEKEEKESAFLELTSIEHDVSLHEGKHHNELDYMTDQNIDDFSQTNNPSLSRAQSSPSDDIIVRPEQFPYLNDPVHTKCSHCQIKEEMELKRKNMMQKIINTCKEMEDVIHRRFQADSCICYPFQIDSFQLKNITTLRPLHLPQSLQIEFLQHLLRLVRPSANEHENRLGNSRVVRHSFGTSKVLIPVTIDCETNYIIRLGYTRCYATLINESSQSLFDNEQQSISQKNIINSNKQQYNDLFSLSNRYRTVEIVIDYDPPSDFVPPPYRVRSAPNSLLSHRRLSSETIFKQHMTRNTDVCSTNHLSFFRSSKPSLNPGSSVQYISQTSHMGSRILLPDSDLTAPVDTTIEPTDIFPVTLEDNLPCMFIPSSPNRDDFNPSQLSNCYDPLLFKPSMWSAHKKTAVKEHTFNTNFVNNPTSSTSVTVNQLGNKINSTQENQEYPAITVGHYASRGRRTRMEDRTVVSLDFDSLCNIPDLPKEEKFFAIYDGHGGSEAVDFISHMFHKELSLTDAYRKGDISKALYETFQIIEEKLMFKLNELIQLYKTYKVYLKHLGLQENFYYTSSTFSPRQHTVSISANLPRGVLQDSFFYRRPSHHMEDTYHSQHSTLTSENSTEIKQSQNFVILSSSSSSFTSAKRHYLDGSNIVTNLSNGGLDELQHKIEFLKGEIETLHNRIDRNKELSKDNFNILIHNNNDDEEEEEEPLTSGSTALVLFIKGTELYIANLGDSRCIISREGRIGCLTEDHRLRSSVHEAERVKKTPGTFSCDGYLCGQLGVSRAFGNIQRRSGKKLLGLSSTPDIIRVQLRSEDEFLILGCDGLFDSITATDAAFTVQKALQSTGDPTVASKQLVEQALINFTEDNVSAIVVSFKSIHPESTLSKTSPITSYKTLTSRLVPIASAPNLPTMIEYFESSSSTEHHYQRQLLGQDPYLLPFHRNGELMHALGQDEHHHPCCKNCTCQKEPSVIHKQDTTLLLTKRNSSNKLNSNISLPDNTRVPYVKKKYCWNVVESP